MEILDTIEKKKKQLLTGFANSTPIKAAANSKAAQTFTNSPVTRGLESASRKIQDFGTGFAKTTTDWAGGQLGKALGQSLAAGYESKANQKIQRQQAAGDKIILDRVKQARQSGNEQEAQRLLGVMNNPKYQTITGKSLNDQIRSYQQGQKDAIVGGLKTAVSAGSLGTTLASKPLITRAATSAAIASTGDAINQKLSGKKVDWQQVGGRGAQSVALEGVMRPVYDKANAIASNITTRLGKPTGRALAKIGQTTAPKLSELIKQGAIRGAVSGALSAAPASAVHSGLKTLEATDFDPNKSTWRNLTDTSRQFVKNYVQDLPGQVISGAAYSGVFGAAGGIGEYKRTQETLAEQIKAGQATSADKARMRQLALKTLDTDENITPAELDKLHKKLILQTHPDRNGGDDTAFRQMQEAYEFLTQGKPMVSTYTSIHQPTNTTSSATTPITPTLLAASDFTYKTDIKTNPKLDARETQVESRALAQFNQNPQGMIDSYIQRVRNNGNILSVDDASELLDAYNENQAENRIATNSVASKLVENAFNYKLTHLDPNKDDIAVFTSGGPASFKSSVLSKVVQKDNIDPQFVFDSNLANINTAKALINQTLDKGLDTKIVLSYRDPLDAWASNLDRAGDGKRVVTLNTFVRNHLDAPETLLKLANEYKNNPKVNFEIYDSRNPDNIHQISLDNLKEILYNRGNYETLDTGKRPALETSDARGFQRSSSGLSREQIEASLKRQAYNFLEQKHQEGLNDAVYRGALRGYEPPKVDPVQNFDTSSPTIKIASPAETAINIAPTNTRTVPINYMNDARGVAIGEYAQVPQGWSIVPDSRIAPEGYTAILDNRPGSSGDKGLIKNENLGLINGNVASQNASSNTIKIANATPSRTDEVMTALTQGTPSTPGSTNDEYWSSLMAQEAENAGPDPQKSTAASVLDPIEETELPDPDDDLELKKQNLDWYRDHNKADQNLAGRAKIEISQLLNPLNSLSKRDRAAFDAWRAKELQAATEAEFLAREWTERFGNPDDQTAWAITQYIQNPTQEEAARLGISEYVKEHEQDFKDLRAFFEDLHEQQKLRTAEDFGHLPNYFPQKWRNTPQEIKKVEDELLKQSGQVRQEHMERRIIPDYKTGVELGLTPKYTHFAPLIGEYYVRANRAIDNYELQHDLMARGLLQTGKKEGKFWNLVTADSLPSGGRKLYAPQAIAKTLDNIWGKGAERSAILGTTAKLNSGLQNMILSGGIPGTPLNSFVYGQVIKEATGGNFAAVKNLAQTFTGDIDTFMKDHRSTIKQMNAQGIRINPGWDYRTEYANIFVKPTDDLVQANGKLEKTLVGLDMVGDKLNSTFGDATFKNFMPRLNMEIFEKAYQEALDLGKTESEAAKFAGDTLKNWRGLTDPYARNKKVQQAIDSIFFAPQYREGMINFWTNLTRSVTSGDVFHSDGAGNKQMRNFIIGTTITYGLMNVANYALNGRFCWENKSGNKLSIEIPETYLLGGEAGRALRAPLLPSTSTMPRNAIEFGLAALEGDGETMRRLAAGYFGMGIKLPLELIGNQDFYGNPIRDSDSSLLNQAGQMASYIAGNYSHPYVGAAVNYLTGRKNALESAAQVLELPAYGSRSTETANLSKKEYDTYKQLAKSGQDAAAFARAANTAKQQKEAIRLQENSTTTSNDSSTSWWRKLKFWDREPVELTPDERQAQIKNRIKVDDRSINSDDLEFYYLQDALDLPDESQLDRAKRNRILFALYDKLDDDDYLDDAQRQNLQQKIMEETGMSSEQMNYYQKAKAAGNNHLKYLTVMDDLAQARIDTTTPEGHEKLLEYLVNARKTIGEKILASDGVITELYERGLISKNESKWLKALDWDEEAGDWKQTSAVTQAANSSGTRSRKTAGKTTSPYASLAEVLRQNGKTTRINNAPNAITIKAPSIGNLEIGRPNLQLSPSLTIGRPQIDPETILRIVG
ncbi:J domain-containing protein [bacterium]|nr:J domain-containing protein [bacterium]